MDLDADLPGQRWRDARQLHGPCRRMALAYTEGKEHKSDAYAAPSLSLHAQRGYTHMNKMILQTRRLLISVMTPLVRTRECLRRFRRSVVGLSRRARGGVVRRRRATGACLRMHLRAGTRVLTGRDLVLISKMCLRTFADAVLLLLLIQR